MVDMALGARRGIARRTRSIVAAAANISVPISTGRILGEAAGVELERMPYFWQIALTAFTFSTETGCPPPEVLSRSG